MNILWLTYSKKGSKKRKRNEHTFYQQFVDKLLITLYKLCTLCEKGMGKIAYSIQSTVDNSGFECG